MYQIVNEYDFTRAFDIMGRGDNFTYHGLRALFEWLEECFHEDNGIELDVIALCCDFAQYESIEEYNRYYETEYESIEELEEAGMCAVIRVEGEEFIVDIH